MKKAMLSFAGLLFSVLIVSAKHIVQVDIKVTEEGNVTREKTTNDGKFKIVRVNNINESESDEETGVEVKKEVIIITSDESTYTVRKTGETDEERIEVEIEQEIPDNSGKKKMKRKK